MIDYELAKELKEAGFKTPEGHENYRGLFKNSDNEIDSRFEEDAVYCPTLEELIEACVAQSGIHHFRLRLGNIDQWRADFDDDFKGEDSTPTEAVARLWLALKSKK